MPEKESPEGKVLDNLEIMLAIELLEYHDSNYLTGDYRTRNIEKRRLIEEALMYIEGVKR